MRVLVAGAGFAGAVCARELADAGHEVLLVERREHLAGNAYDHLDGDGVLVHAYGPHIFHTNSDRVLAWLSRFTAWRRYEHRVLAWVDGDLYPLPINRTTINRLYGLDLDEAGVRAYLDRVRIDRPAGSGAGSEPRTSEDVVLAGVGPDLCERFFRGYTAKQWGLDLSQLSASVAARIPVRTGDDDRYFTDTHQLMPADGYTAMFTRILDHPGITVHTRVELARVRGTWPHDHLVYTGPVDEYFGWRLGPLPYRSLTFEHEHYPDVARFQPVGTVNYPNDHAFTRITEFRHLTGQDHPGTSVVREYPCAVGDPYYPVPRPENAQRYAGYKALADAEPGVSFVGRLAEYRYYNMDQVVASALALSRRLIETAPAPSAVDARGAW